MKILEKFLQKDFPDAKLNPLPGEEDLNFKLTSSSRGEYLIKLIQKEKDWSFQHDILYYVFGKKGIQKVYDELLEITDTSYRVHVIHWFKGKVWDKVNYKPELLYRDLGLQAGKITQKLYGFKHHKQEKSLDWDLAQFHWIPDYLNLFQGEELLYIQNAYQNLLEQEENYKTLRKSVIHNDLNEHNILVSFQEHTPYISGLIDFGDAIYTQTINDLAILVAYACMELDNPLKAFRAIVKGYHEKFPLHKEELAFLPALIKIRYAISLVKSKINQTQHPENTYLQISTEKVWKGMKTWSNLSENYIYYHALDACGMENDHANQIKSVIQELHLNLNELIPGPFIPIDCSVAKSDNAIQQSIKNNSIGIGGYLEPRLFYTTDAFKKEDLYQTSFRSIHLGVDFWNPAGTPIKAPLDGEVVISHDNNYDKDYGPTIVLKHHIQEVSFFTLYGHLKRNHLPVGSKIKKGEVFAHVGEQYENGNWIPHLHFQITTDLIGNTENFPGVAYPEELNIWRQICPDPLIIFGKKSKKWKFDIQELLHKRHQVLGKNLSLSYQEPLLILQGKGTYLYDYKGQKYLDLVNNVAHVGHENPEIVRAGTNQMETLNTNTRYLHPSLIQYAEELLETLPSRFSRIYLVNSGSEANELALRIAKTVSEKNGILALKHGYHGNTENLVKISSYKFEGKGGFKQDKNTFLIDNDDPQLNKTDDVAAFIYESILSCAGQIPLHTDFSMRVEPELKSRGIWSIADEVQTGFGRVGSHFWAFEYRGMQPDMVTMGKPIGNGHPLGAVAVTEELAEQFHTGMEFFNTFGGNPVSAEIGLAVLREIKRENLQEKALLLGNILKKELAKIKHPYLTEVRGQGLFLGIVFEDTNGKPLKEFAKFVSESLMQYGILISTDGPEENVLKIKPPLSIDQKDMEYFIHKIFTVLQNSMDFIQ